MTLESKTESGKRTTFERDNEFITSCPNLAFVRLFFEPLYIYRLASHIPGDHSLGKEFRKKAKLIGLGLEAAKFAGYGLGAYGIYNYFS